MVLVLAGGGVERGHLTLMVVEELRRADRVYVDTYTMPGAGWLLEEARRFSSNVVEAGRGDLEAGAWRVVEEAREARVVVLVPGDPLVATTHVSLLVEAARRGVEWRVVPGVSGVTAAKAASSLQYYKFGRTATIPGPWRGVRAYSVVGYVYANLCVGLHTLLLLDVDEHGRQLPPGEGVSSLLAWEEELAGELGFEPVLPRLMGLVVYRAGTGEPRVTGGRLPQLRGAPGGQPSSVVVPGMIHPTEAEALEALYGVERALAREHNEVVREKRASLCSLQEGLV